MLTDLWNKDRLITSIKYTKNLLWDNIKRCNRLGHLRPTGVLKPTRRTGNRSGPTSKEWKKIKNFNKVDGISVDRVRVSVMTPTCKAIIAKNNNTTKIIHLVPMILNDVERVPNIRIATLYLPCYIRYRSTKNNIRPKEYKNIQWAVFWLNIANKTATEATTPVFDEKNYSLRNYERFMFTQPHTFEGVIQSHSNITLYEVMQKLVAMPTMTILNNTKDIDIDIVFEHREHHLYELSGIKEKSPDIFLSINSSEKVEVLKNKNTVHKRENPKNLKFFKGN